MARRLTDAQRSQWAERLRRQAESGLSISAFCRKHSISESRFYYWRRRLATGKAVDSTPRSRGPESPRFVQLQKASGRLASCVEICVASGALIRVPADNVAAIEAAVCAVASSPARPEGEVADA